jgi:hypothetical protein
MSADEFFRRWASRLGAESREVFRLELALLLTFEQTRERHRRTTGVSSSRNTFDTTGAEARSFSSWEGWEPTA